MNYTRLVERFEPVVRFGRLGLAFTQVDLPAVAPVPRTKAEALAVLGLVKNGVLPQVISPLASRATTTMPLLSSLLQPQEPGVVAGRPFVVADPETEAFAFGCSARWHFAEAQKPTPLLNGLMQSTLTSTRASWRRTRTGMGFTALLDYTFAAQERARSDVRFFPTSIMRADEGTVTEAVGYAEEMVKGTKPDPRFIDGVQFLLHGEMFDSSGISRRAREAFLAEAQKFRTGTTFAKKVIGVKVYHNGLTTFKSPAEGHLARANLSAFLYELAENVQAADGLLVAHNWYNWSLGLLDSGADIVTSRLDGRMDIEVPMKGQKGRRGPQQPPGIYVPRAMADYTEAEVKEAFERDGAFPAAPGVGQEPYWTYKMSEKRRFAAQTRVGGFVELGREYRESGLDEERRLAEDVRSRVEDSRISADLRDLCMSLRA